MQVTKADIIILIVLATMFVGPLVYFYLMGYR